MSSYRNMPHTDVSHWKEFKGLGTAKIAQIKAAIEVGRRFKEEEVREDRPKVKSSKDVAEILFLRMRDLKKEVFKALLLNSQNKIINIIEIIAGKVLQVKILDHIIIGNNSYFSFADEGFI